MRSLRNLIYCLESLCYGVAVMNKVIIYITVMILWMTTNPALSFSQVDEFGRWVNGIMEPWIFNRELFSENDVLTSQSKWKTIESEYSSSLNHEWEGEYCITGETSLRVLRWAPTSGFVVFSVSTCSTEVRSLDYGAVSATANYVLLTSQKSVSFEERSIKYLPVKWGGRHYLIKESEVADFYDFVAGYSSKSEEDMPIGFLLRSGEGERPVEGMPILPPGYEQFEKAPIDAAITEIQSRKIKRCEGDDESLSYESRTLVKLNAGSADGVKRKMVFNIIGSETDESVEIVRVRKEYSIGVIVRSLDEEMAETYKDWETDKIVTYPQISTGWRVSTRPKYQ